MHSSKLFNIPVVLSFSFKMIVINELSTVAFLRNEALLYTRHTCCVSLHEAVAYTRCVALSVAYMK